MTKVTVRSPSHDAINKALDPGKRMQMIAFTGNEQVDRALLDLVASLDGTRQFLTSTAPPPPPPFRSPLDANRELSAENSGRRLDLGVVWTGLEGLARQIDAVRDALEATGSDALEEDPMNDRTRDAATVRRMARAGRAVWSTPGSLSSQANDRAAAVRTAVRAASAAGDTRTLIRALNDASRALWAPRKPAA